MNAGKEDAWLLPRAGKFDSTGPFAPVDKPYERVDQHGTGE